MLSHILCTWRVINPYWQEIFSDISYLMYNVNFFQLSQPWMPIGHLRNSESFLYCMPEIFILMIYCIVLTIIFFHPGKTSNKEVKSSSMGNCYQEFCSNFWQAAAESCIQIYIQVSEFKGWEGELMAEREREREG